MSFNNYKHGLLLRIVCLFHCLCIAGLSNAQTENIKFVGYAYSLADSSLLYSEHHSINIDHNRKRVSAFVQYRSVSGDVIADKNLKYDDQGYFPDFNFTDKRTNQFLKVEKSNNKISISKTTGINQKIQTDHIKPVAARTMIADAGFDVFMLNNWQSLLAGKALLVEFLAPTRNMFVTFKIKQTYINSSVVGFRLSPNNFFISLLVEPIYLEYELTTGRILSYKGLTNIEQVVNGKAQGKNILAHIQYAYPVKQ